MEARLGEHSEVVTKAFAKQLALRDDLPFELFDERLSTFQAEELMQQASVPPARRQKLRDGGVGIT